MMNNDNSHMHKEMTRQFYRKRADGKMGFAEISSYSYPDVDRFHQAVDLFYEEGYFDTREEAEAAE